MEKKTILLVEDEVFIALDEKATLEEYNYHVISVSTGEKAVQAVEENPDIDLILMDINLGDGMDGTTAAKHILKRHDIPLIFLSSHTEREVVEKTEGITSYGYIVKNTGETVLMASVKMAFRLFNAKQQILNEKNWSNRIISSAPNIIVGLGEDSRIFIFNKFAEELTGYKSEDVLGKEWIDMFIPEEDKKEIHSVWKDIVSNQMISHQFENYIILKSGIKRLIRWNNSLLTENNQFKMILSIGEDITDRKKAEDAFMHSHDLMKYIIEHSNSAIAVHDRDLKYIYVSQSYLDQYKVKEQNIIGKHHYEIFPDLPEKWRIVHQKALNGEVSHGEKDPYDRADGTVEWTHWECRPWYEGNGDIGGIIVYTQVITDLVKEKEALKESEARFRMFAELAPVGIVISHRNENVEYISPKFVEMFGYTDNEIKKADDWFKLAYPNKKLREKVRQSWENEINHARETGREIHPLEYSVTCKDGSVKNIEFRMKSSDKLNLIILTDITERKISEEIIRKSENWFRTMADTTTTAIFIYQDKKFVFINNAAEQMTGYNKEELFSFSHIWDIAHPDYKDLVRKRMDKRMQGEEVTKHYQVKILRKDGSERWIDLTAGVIEWDGKSAVIGTAYDISIQKDYEESLRKYQNLLLETQKMSHTGSWELSLNNHQLNWSEEVYRIFGLDQEKFKPTYQSFLEIVHPEDRMSLDKAYTDSLNNNQTGYEIFHRIIRRSTGEIRFIHEKCIHEKNSDGQVIRSIGMVQDITESKNVEKELLKAQQELEEYFTSSLDLLCIANTKGEFIRLNPEWEKVLGYPIHELEGRNFLELIHPDDLKDTLKTLSTLSAQNEVLNFENRYRCKDGSYRWIEWRSHPSGETIYAVARDVTNRKKTEEKIQTLLREKELLLKETHHRIKNNMGIVKSLLNLQAKSFANHETEIILNDAAGRVQSMMVLYDKLYRSEAYNELNIKVFLPSLIHEIISLFTRDNPVNTVIELEDIILDAKTLSTLGIILNECITNSMKYAFQATAKPLITVRSFRKDEKIIINYEDNGSGFMNSYTGEQTGSFGLRLIEMLVSQLNGNITIQSSNGMKTAISFSPPKAMN